MANSDADILSKLEEGSDGFVSMPIRLKKSGEPYKNSPVMSTQDFHYMGAYARKKAAELGERIYKGEIHPRPYKKEQPVITVLSQMSVDLIRSCQVMSTRVFRECLWRKS